MIAHQRLTVDKRNISEMNIESISESLRYLQCITAGKTLDWGYTCIKILFDIDKPKKSPFMAINCYILENKIIIFLKLQVNLGITTL